MAPIGGPIAEDEAMENESDFRDWTLEMDVMNNQHSAVQAAEDTALENTMTAIQTRIQADTDGLFNTLSAYMQQCLEKMQQEMSASVARQVQHRLQLEKTKAEFEARRQQRNEAKKRQIVDLFDKHHFPTSARKKSPQFTFKSRNKPFPQPNTRSPYLQNTLNGHASKTNSPRPQAANSSFNDGSMRGSVDSTTFVEPGQAQRSVSTDRPTFSTPGPAQSNRTSAAPEARANNTSTPVAEARNPLSVDLDRGSDPLGIGSSKRKGETFASSPADTVKRARIDLSKDAEAHGTAERDASDGPQRPSSQRSIPPQRSVSFAEVYKDGHAEHKHIILEYMDGSGKFYILKCDEHQVHFGGNPLAGAAKHLASSQHNKLPKTHELAIEKLGYLVLDCNRELMEKNNAAFHEAVKRGYEPFNANRLTKAEKMALGIEATDSPAPSQDISKRKSKGPEPVEAGMTPQKEFRGLTEVKYGQLYLGYWSKTKTKFPVIVLPLGDLKAAGLRGTLMETSLRKTVPKCYVVQRQADTRVITGWSKGYEDGGPLVTKREFPVMYFDKHNLVGWIAAKHLSPFSLEDPTPTAYPGYDDARNYWARIQDDGCTGYDDWISRGRIRNPTESPEPQNSDEASPLTGNLTPDETTNGTGEAAASAAAKSGAAEMSDDRQDQVMTDVGTVHAGGNANEKDPVRDSDVEMDMGNQEFVETTPISHGSQIRRRGSLLTTYRTSSASKPQENKISERSVAGEELRNTITAATTTETSRPSPLKTHPPSAQNTTANPLSAITGALSSGKPAEKAPQALSIPTPPLNSTEASPITAASPGLSASSTLTSLASATSQNFATKALGVKSTQNPKSRAEHIQQAQPDQTGLSRVPSEVVRQGSIFVQASDKGSKIIDARVKAASPTARPTASAASMPPQHGMSPERHHTPIQTYIRANSNPSVHKAYSPIRPGPVSRNSTPTGILDAAEAARRASAVREAVSPRRESHSGFGLQQPRVQSHSPALNGRTTSPFQDHAIARHPLPRSAGTSPVPTARPTFSNVAEQSRPITAARSLSPSFGPYRSASSTPTPAAEVISRKGTPTIVRGDSLDRWKAVRNPSPYMQPPQSSILASGPAGGAVRGPTTPQDRRGFSLSSLMTASAGGLSPMKPDGLTGGKDQFFDVVGYRDSTDAKTYLKDEKSPFLRVTVNTARGIAETAPGEAIAVTINPRDVLRVIVKNIDQDKATVALTLKDPNNPPEFWAFGTKMSSGRPVSGKIQARLFCQWVKSINPNAHYVNSSTDNSRQSSAGRSPFLMD